LSVRAPSFVLLGRNFLFSCEDFGGEGTLRLAAPRMAHGSLGLCFRKSDYWERLYVELYLAAPIRFLGASVGRFYSPTVVHDREAHQEKSERLCVSLRLCGAFFFFGCGATRLR
jgi:hypothetical protein